MHVTGTAEGLQAVEIGGYNVLPLLSSACRLEIRMGIAAVCTAETELEMFSEAELTGHGNMFEEETR